jgi:hypothetical protein
MQQLLHHPPLVGGGRVQNGVQGGDHRQSQTAHEIEQMTAGGSAIDAKFVLNAEQIRVGEIDEVGGALIAGEAAFGQLKTHHLGIVVVKAWIGDAEHGRGPRRPLTRHRLMQITGEGGNTALAGRKITKKADLASVSCPHLFTTESTTCLR